MWYRKGRNAGMNEHLLCKVLDRPRGEGVVTRLDVDSVDVNKVGIGSHRLVSQLLPWNNLAPFSPYVGRFKPGSWGT
jgi:hypothetical protein